MKRIFSKNTVIGLLILSNVALCCAFVAKELRLSKWKDLRALFVREEKTVKPPPAPQGDIKEATLKDSTQVQACYDSLLSRQPRANEGAVIMHWIFNEQGHIDFLKLVRSDMQDEPFINCLMATVRTTRIPASDSRIGKLISHKFTFRRRTPAELEFH
jgi:hypothetical protein